jgi:hypothetical protein
MMHSFSYGQAANHYALSRTKVQDGVDMAETDAVSRGVKLIPLALSPYFQFAIRCDSFH